MLWGAVPARSHSRWSMLQSSMSSDQRQACRAHNPRRLGLFDAQGSHFTTTRGDSGHLAGR